MESYDPLRAPIPGEWLELSEDERLILVEDYHRRAGVKLPNTRLHAALHAVIETQVATGEPPPVAPALERLQAEGLDRHDALHAICQVLVSHFHALMTGEMRGFSQEAYAADLAALTAESWRASADDPEWDEVAWESEDEEADSQRAER